MKLSTFGRAAILAATLHFVAAPAMAQVVTFEGFGANTIFGDELTGNGLNVATSNGFNFTSSGDHFHFGNGLFGVPSNGTSILLQDRSYTINMSRVGGAPFNLISADMGEDVSFSLPATRVDVTGFFSGGGSISTQVLLDGNSNLFQNALFPGFNNLSSATFRGAGNQSLAIEANGFSMDNVLTSAVPEPTCILLLAPATVSLARYRVRRQIS
jgi:hypothetical protein